MSEPYRVAVYAAPGALGDSTLPEGSPTHSRLASILAERAEAWLGRASDGRIVTAKTPTGWSRAAVDALTTDPRRYGFHATLKAPFRLRSGHSVCEFDQAVADFASSRHSLILPQLKLTRIAGFYALVPDETGDTGPLQALAGELVTGLDTWRAPLTETERARRNPEKLSERQHLLLERWGYPYVLEEFRFHLTLTDRVPQERREAVEAVLNQWFETVIGQQLVIDALTVFVEPEAGAAFILHSVHPLGDRSIPDQSAPAQGSAPAAAPAAFPPLSTPIPTKAPTAQPAAQIAPEPTTETREDTR